MRTILRTLAGKGSNFSTTKRRRRQQRPALEALEAKLVLSTIILHPGDTPFAWTDVNGNHDTLRVTGNTGTALVNYTTKATGTTLNFVSLNSSDATTRLIYSSDDASNGKPVPMGTVVNMAGTNSLFGGINTVSDKVGHIPDFQLGGYSSGFSGGQLAPYGVINVFDIVGPVITQLNQKGQLISVKGSVIGPKGYIDIAKWDPAHSAFVPSDLGGTIKVDNNYVGLDNDNAAQTGLIAANVLATGRVLVRGNVTADWHFSGSVFAGAIFQANGSVGFDSETKVDGNFAGTIQANHGAIADDGCQPGLLIGGDIQVGALIDNATGFTGTSANEKLGPFGLVVQASSMSSGTISGVQSTVVIGTYTFDNGTPKSFTGGPVGPTAVIEGGGAMVVYVGDFAGKISSTDTLEFVSGNVLSTAQITAFDVANIPAAEACVALLPGGVGFQVSGDFGGTLVASGAFEPATGGTATIVSGDILPTASITVASPTLAGISIGGSIDAGAVITFYNSLTTGLTVYGDWYGEVNIQDQVDSEIFVFGVFGGILNVGENFSPNGVIGSAPFTGFFYKDGTPTGDLVVLGGVVDGWQVVAS
jgi:hypothetical protein